MNKARFTPAQINALSRGDFTGLIGPMFEASPWIADATWPKRPFTDLNHLHRALCQTVTDAGAERQVQLINAHPDLVGRAALAGTLTPESTGEQSAAGLHQLSADEIELFRSLNHSYREKFGFPFVICARLNKKDAILAGFRARLHHSRDVEIKTAIEEIAKIARLRLEDLIDP
jgi:OHCU decarboxylase